MKIENAIIILLDDEISMELYDFDSFKGNRIYPRGILPEPLVDQILSLPYPDALPT